MWLNILLISFFSQSILFSIKLSNLNPYFIILIPLSILLHFIFYKSNHFGTADIPNERSMHLAPTKKSAGIVFFSFFIIASFLNDLILIEQSKNLPFYLGSLFLMILGFIDDKKNLSFKLKLSLEVLFFLAYYYFFPNQDYMKFACNEFSMPPILLVFLLTCITVFFINIVNFMDGIDAYVILIASFYLSILLRFPNQSFQSVQILAVFLLCSSGFCLFNFPKAKLFMGDAGSLPLGFYLFSASNFLLGDGQNSKLSAGFGLVVYLPFLFLNVFIVDSILTILIRLVQKKNIFQAHKEHLYQLVSLPF